MLWGFLAKRYRFCSRSETGSSDLQTVRQSRTAARSRVERRAPSLEQPPVYSLYGENRDNSDFILISATLRPFSASREFPRLMYSPCGCQDVGCSGQNRCTAFISTATHGLSHCISDRSRDPYGLAMHVAARSARTSRYPSSLTLAGPVALRGSVHWPLALPLSTRY